MVLLIMLFKKEEIIQTCLEPIITKFTSIEATKNKLCMYTKYVLKNTRIF